MASIEEVITELKRLSPDQVDEVARIIRALSRAECRPVALHHAVPACVVDEAVQHGWPAQLFTQLIGSLPDLERAPQPPLELREDL
ncbi:MAG: hypothetical protein LAQ69_15800 [Acidobacteriia bacterium]|nr:hypothetical protein [Terriglobia bacterium]